MEINGELHAYIDTFLTSNMVAFTEGLANGRTNKALDALTLCDHDFSKTDSSYIKVGIARISIEIEADQNEIIRKAVATMEAKRDDLLAEARIKATAIDAQIQNLLAITYEG
mgnify:CR=1 FL=1